MSTVQQVKNIQSPLDKFRTQVKREIKKNYPSVERFCFENDISKSILSRLLSGKQKEFKLNTLQRIANALEKQVDIILK